MRRVVSKRLRKEAAKAFPNGSRLMRNKRTGTRYWQGMMRSYRDAKKAYAGGVA